MTLFGQVSAVVSARARREESRCTRDEKKLRFLTKKRHF